MLEHGDAAVVPHDADSGLFLTLRNARRDVHMECLVAAFHRQVDRSALMRVEVLGQRGQAEQGLSISRHNEVARLQSGLGRRAIGKHFGHHRGLRGQDADLAQLAASPTFAFGHGRLNLDLHHLTITLEFDRNKRLLAADHIPSDAFAHVAHAGEFAHLVAIDLENAVAGLQSGFGRGSVGQDITDDRGAFRLADRTTNEPDNHRADQSQRHAGQRTGDGDDDFVHRRDRRQSGAVVLALSFDRFHWRELRQRNKPAGRDRSQAVFHPADRLFPDRLAEPDAELFHDQTPPARGKEVAQLVGDDDQVKKEQDLEKDSRHPQVVSHNDRPS